MTCRFLYICRWWRRVAQTPSLDRCLAPTRALKTPIEATSWGLRRRCDLDRICFHAHNDYFWWTRPAHACMLTLLIYRTGIMHACCILWSLCWYGQAIHLCWLKLVPAAERSSPQGSFWLDPDRYHCNDHRDDSYPGLHGERMLVFVSI